MLVFGEDVGRKGGVYGVTRGLQRRFGITRVFDTLLDEQTILGVALGCGVSGLLPVPEIQYLAYLHNAEDQLRGEAATLPFFSNGQYRNPMVAADRRIRLPEGLRRPFPQRRRRGSPPGHTGAGRRVSVAARRRGGDAPHLPRGRIRRRIDDACFSSRSRCTTPATCSATGDGAWLAPYPPPSQWSECHAPIGSARVHGDGERSDDRHVRQRHLHVTAGGAPSRRRSGSTRAWWTYAGSPHCR